MYQNYNFQQPMQMRQPALGSTLGGGMFLKGRPVSSIEEARAATIDFDGSIFYFPDYANKRIYTKQINIDGTSTFMVYNMVEVPVEQPTEYVTREEFQLAIKELAASLGQSSPSDPAAPSPEEKPKFNF